MQRHFIYILLIMIGYAPISQAQKINTSGDWTVSIPDNYKVKEAGMDYVNGIIIESANNQTLIKVKHHALHWNWRVSVSSSNIPNNMVVSCRRTGNGTPTFFSSIYGGENYIEISSIEKPFFEGWLRYKDIPIQYKLSNLSVTMPVKTYTIDITYTIISL